MWLRGMSEHPTKKARTLQGNVCWTDSRFSDWTVRLGSRVFNLHRFCLARASTFFESHMEIAELQQTRHTDITEVLPKVCHSVFEDILEFIYSENKSDFFLGAPQPKLVVMLKAAEVLGMTQLIEHIVDSQYSVFSWSEVPDLLQQYIAVHVEGTDDGCAMQGLLIQLVEEVASSRSL